METRIDIGVEKRSVEERRIVIGVEKERSVVERRIIIGVEKTDQWRMGESLLE